MKLIGWIVGIVLLIVVGSVVYVVINSGSLLKTAVETLGPDYLGVDVSLDAAEISLMDGSGELRGLTIGNPAGFGAGDAFKLGRIKLVIDPSEIGEELIVVKLIEIDAADLAIVAKGRDTNLQAIMNNLESSDADTGADGGPELIIDAFDFTNARTSLDSDLLGEKTVDLPDIHLADIGRKSQGVTIREALTQILRPIVGASTKALAKESLNLDELQKNAEQQLDEVLGKQEVLQKQVGSGLDELKGRFRN